MPNKMMLKKHGALLLVATAVLCLAAVCSADDTLRFEPSSSSLMPNPLCPDKQGTCPDKSTCCKLGSGKYGCCPLPNAVCCSDHIHCCPSGFTCNIAEGRCNQGDLHIDWMQKVATNDVVCPDKRFECPNGQTCCKRPQGDYGCCPIPQAVCCSDGLHCCPPGYTCNVGAGTCQKGANAAAIAWISMVAGQKAQTDKVISLTLSHPVTTYKDPLTVTCSDGSMCPQDTTCCSQDSNGSFQCCPLNSGVCCSDGKHCCVHGSTCDLDKKECRLSAHFRTPMYPTRASVPQGVEQVKDVICPDSQSSCPPEQTCCMMLTGQYGCCPLPKATCCSDHLHCCDEGATCDLEKQTCVHADGVSVPWETKQPAKKVDEEKEDEFDYSFKDEIDLTMEHLAELEKEEEAERAAIDCPDKKSTCPAGTTCCQMLSGDYGCCPMQDAVCCSDHLHCCESDEKCDVAKGACTHSESGEETPLKKKIPATPKTPVAESSEFACPDKISTCPTGTTCCEMQSGYYGCCPHQNAKCCANKLHCCPADEECDNEKGICTKSPSALFSVPMSKKQPANTECPGGKDTCPSDQTCCLMDNGEYGCCPYPKAVCCSDHLHCCPSGYTCDTAAGKCNPGENSLSPSIPWSVKTPARPVEGGTEEVETVNVITCPDGQSTCDNSQTCCQMSGGAWGCCPMPQAVCCSDGIHCCPEGTTCDLAHSMCQHTSSSLAISFTQIRQTFNRIRQTSDSIRDTYNRINELKSVVQKKEEELVGAVVCKDKSECPDGTTCCEQSAGKYACCPLEKAVCCSDKVHCCPMGTTCDVKEGRCNKESSLSENWSSIPWLEKIPAVEKPQEKVEDVKDGAVVCPDRVHQCPNGNTCCMLASGQWGCCQFQRAVCCSDHIHCCPSEFTCDTEHMRCVHRRSSLTLDWAFYARSRAQLMP